MKKLLLFYSVVSLRQLERQMDRERAKQAEKIQSSESQYQQHMVKLQQQLQAVERERNLCMVRTFNFISFSKSNFVVSDHLYK